MSTDNPANWVERRVLSERLLKTGALEFWNQIRSALQDACQSFNSHYVEDGRFPQRVEAKLENGLRIRIVVPSRREAMVEMLVVEFDRALSVVSATTDSGPGRTLPMRSDGLSVFVVFGGRNLNADEVSEELLENLFPFPGAR
jgi:hypothetical protein